MSNQKCKRCGCTEHNACTGLVNNEDGDGRMGACYWIQPDLCSACATLKERSDYCFSVLKVKKRKGVSLEMPKYL